MGATNSSPNTRVAQLLRTTAGTNSTAQSSSRVFSRKVVGLWHPSQLARSRIGGDQRTLPNRIHSQRPPIDSPGYQQRSSESKAYGSRLARSNLSANMGGKVDIVTLEDFHNTQPEWSPDRPSHLYAVVDMGR